MKWTTKPPNKDGYYWRKYLRGDKGSGINAVVIQVRSCMMYRIGVEFPTAIYEHEDFQWKGPIKP